MGDLFSALLYILPEVKQPLTEVSSERIHFNVKTHSLKQLFVCIDRMCTDIVHTLLSSERQVSSV